MDIAIDFDGTITEQNLFPKIGKFRPHAAETINALQAAGHRCILWTCRGGKELEDAVRALKEHGIQMDACNENPSIYTGSPKLVADVYIDDASFHSIAYRKPVDWDDVARAFGIIYS